MHVFAEHPGQRSRDKAERLTLLSLGALELPRADLAWKRSPVENTASPWQWKGGNLTE